MKAIQLSIAVITALGLSCTAHPEDCASSVKIERALIDSQSGSAELQHGRLAEAPMPRRVNFPPSLNGVVTALDHESITLRFLGLQINDISHTSDQWHGQSRVLILTGRPLTVISTISPLFPGGVIHPVRCEYAYRYSGAESFTFTEADGTRRILKRADQSPRRFEVSDALRLGGYSTHAVASYSHSYRLADVKIGDVVRLRFERTDTYNIVDAICISSRPGGKVPAAPAQPKDVKMAFHEVAQAYQDWEEKGIPLPFELHPGGPWPQQAPPPRAK